MCWKNLSHTTNLGGGSKPLCQPLLPQLLYNWTICDMPSTIFVLGEMCWEPRAFFSTLYQSNENGYDDYMCKCTKSLTLQRYIIPKLQKKFKACIYFFKGWLNASPEKRWLFSKSATAGEDSLAQLWPACYCCIFLIISADTGGWKLIVWCRRPWAVL